MHQMDLFEKEVENKMYYTHIMNPKPGDLLVNYINYLNFFNKMYFSV